jgi:hypothetical protein
MEKVHAKKQGGRHEGGHTRGAGQTEWPTRPRGASASFRASLVGDAPHGTRKTVGAAKLQRTAHARPPQRAARHQSRKL